MATPTQTPETPTAEGNSTSAQPITKYLNTYGRINYVESRELNKETGEEQVSYDKKWVNEKTADTVAKSHKFEGEQATLDFKQTFNFPKANTPEGVIALFTDKDGVFQVEEYLNQVNNAISVKLGNKTRSMGMEFNKETKEYTFELQAEPIDMTEYVAEPTRQRRSAFEKLFDDAASQVNNFSPEMRAQLIALLQSGAVTQ